MKQIRRDFQQILAEYNFEDKVLFQLGHPSKKHTELSSKYPYQKNDELNPLYLQECMATAIKLYDALGFSQDLLIVYDDVYNKASVEKEFLEGTLGNIKETDSYKFKWQFPEEDALYTCERTLYRVENFDRQQLFETIILSDIGGDLDLASAVFIIDLSTKVIFHLYDDRGASIYFLKKGA